MKEGDTTGGHDHNFDHVTILFSGAVRVEADGKTELFRSSVGHHPKIWIKAGVVHSITALEDNTYLECWYVHRDENGYVVEEYQGNMAAVQ